MVYGLNVPELWLPTLALHCLSKPVVLRICQERKDICERLKLEAHEEGQPLAGNAIKLPSLKQPAGPASAEPGARWFNGVRCMSRLIMRHFNRIALGSNESSGLLFCCTET